MLHNPELALDYREALVSQSDDFYVRPNFIFWKIFLAVLLSGFALVAFPHEGSMELSLTGPALLQLTNQDRLREGLPALSESAELEQAARAKAEHILRNGYFAHTSPAGVQPWDFLKSIGYSYNFAGENLAINYQSAYELEKDFLESPAHRENLLSPLYTEAGIAVVAGHFQGEPAIITVQMFAAPANESVAIK